MCPDAIDALSSVWALPGNPCENVGLTQAIELRPERLNAS